MANPISFKELFDTEGMVTALNGLIDAEKQFASQTNNDLKILQKTSANLRLDLEKLANEFRNVNIASDAGRKELVKLEAQSAKLRKEYEDANGAIAAQKKILSDLKQKTLEYRAEQERLLAESIKVRNEKKQSAIEAQKLSKQIQDLKNQTLVETIATKQATNAMKAAAGSYNEANERAKALLKSIKAVENGFESTNPEIIKQIEEYRNLNAQLLKFEQQLGINYRNVGNYKSGFNGLSVSINQLTRELPAFTNNLQTGFLAISNNIPMLADELRNIKNANVELAKEGKPTVSVLKALSTAFFSWQTALSLGITILTVYGPKLFELVSGLFKSKEAFNAAAKSIEIYNEAFKNSDYQEAITNVSSLKNNLKLLENGFITKKQVIDQYNETIGKTTGAITSISEAEKFLENQTGAYIKMMYLRAAATISQQKAAEEYIKELELNNAKELKLADRRSKLNALEQEEIKQLESLRRPENSINTDRLITDRKAYFANERKKINDKELQDEIDTTVKRKSMLEKLTTDLYQQAGKIASDNKFNLFSDEEIKENLKTIYDELKEQSEKLSNEVKANLTSGKTVPDSLIKKLNEVNKKIEEIDSAFLRLTTPDFAKFKLEIKFDQEKYDQETQELLDSTEDAAIQLGSVWDKAYAARTKSERDNMDAAKKYAIKNNEDYKKTYVEFLKSGYQSFEEYEKNKTEVAKKETDKKLQLIQMIADVSSTLGNAIFEFAKYQSERELNLITKKKEQELEFAGDNAQAQKMINEKYAAEENKLKIKQAKRDKLQALFNIGLNTAEAITRSVALSPLTGGMPFAAIAATIGAIQAALVLARPLPQFYKGTTSSPEGPALVGERGQELIKSPSGKMELTGNKAEVRYLEKGSVVYTATETKRMLENSEVMSMTTNGKEILYQSNTVVSQKPSLSKNDFTEAMDKSLDKLPINQFSFDESGFKHSVVKGASRTTNRNSRF